MNKSERFTRKSLIELNMYLRVRGVSSRGVSSVLFDIQIEVSLNRSEDGVRQVVPPMFSGGFKLSSLVFEMINYPSHSFLNVRETFGVRRGDRIPNTL